MRLRPLNTIAPGRLETPNVSSWCAGAPTRACGSVTPLRIGARSPTVAAVSEKNTIATNVSTSGMRFSWTSPNFWNMARRRPSRSARARSLCISASSGIVRRDLHRARGAGQRDLRQIGALDALENVHDVVVGDVVVGHDHRRVVIGELCFDLLERRLERVERCGTESRDVLRERRSSTVGVLDTNETLLDADGENQ